MVDVMLCKYYDKLLSAFVICIPLLFTSCSATEEAVIDLTAEHIVLGTEIPNHIIKEEINEKIINFDNPVVFEASEIETAEMTIETMLQDSFTKHDISDDVFLRIQNKSYGENCDIPLSELSYIRVLHYGFDGGVYIGELIVNKKIEDIIIEIFKELFDEKYPIERMVLIDEYNADDNLSMKDNNTSCFNYRVIQGSSALSNHAYGMAVDINPFYNPYIRVKGGVQTVLPDNASEYTDRELDCEYYIKKDDVCYNAFIKRGFTWGGEWESLKDYQHFEHK